MPAYLTSPTCWVIFLCSLVGTGVLTPVVIRFARKLGAVDRGGYRKVYQGAMPLLGGVAVAIPFLAVCILGILRPTAMLRTIGEGRADLAILMIGCTIVLALGIVDDIRGMRARTKFVFQIVAALFICAAGHTIMHLEIPLFGMIHLPAFLGLLVTVLWIVGITNAFNLVDGVDGLASGIAFIASVGLAIIAASNGATFVVILCIALAGSLLAFLAYNTHPAKIFLGDTGSMFVGFTLATVALMGSYKSQAAVIFTAPILALGLPIFETIISVLRRFIRGRPLFVGDHGHTHHRLLKRGLSQRQVAATLYAVAMLCMSAAILAQVLSEKSRAAWIPIGLYVVTVLGLAWVAGYIHPGDALKTSKRRQHNVLLSALSRYVALSLGSGMSLLSAGEILRMVRRELKLRFLEVWFEENLALIAWSGRMRLNGSSESNPQVLDEDFVVAPNGFAMNGGPDRRPVNTLEETRCQSVNGHSLIIRFQYYQKPEEIEHQDSVAYLVDMFAQTKISPPKAPPPDDSSLMGWEENIAATRWKTPVS